MGPHGYSLKTTANRTSCSRIIGSGEMADLIRTYNWSTTPLGPMEEWSDNLVCCLNTMLACAFPSLVFWGWEMVQFYNDKCRPLLGEKHPLSLGQTASECWSEAWSIIGPELAAVLERGETIAHERVLVPILRHGRLEEVYWNYSYSPVFSSEGDVAGILVVCQDITAELLTARSLQESEERASRVLNSIGDAVIVTDAETLIMRMNPVAETLTGWMIEEAAGRPLKDVFHVVHESSGAVLENPAERVKRLGTVVVLEDHTTLVSKDGTQVPIDNSGAPIRDPDGSLSGIVLVFRSVAERRQAAAALKHSEERLRIALAAAKGVGIWDWDVPHDRVYSETGFALLYGVDPEQAPTGLPLAEFLRKIHPDDLPRVEKDIQQALNELVEFSSEYRLIQPDGSARWVFALGRCTIDEGGSPSRFAGITIDITERKLTEQALRESEARFQSIYSTSQEYIGIITPDGKILDCNRASLQFAGNTREDVVGIAFWDGPWFAYTQGAPEMVRYAVSRAAEGELFKAQVPLHRPSGEIITFDFSITPVFDQAGKVVFLVPEGKDVSELKRAEAALLQSEKLAAVGRLASSIAHEINNPLEAVTNLLYLAAASAHTPEVSEYLKTADHELRRVSVIVNQTLRFHKQSSKPRAVSAEELFATVLGIYERKLENSNISLEMAHRAARPIVCFEGDVRQVLNNLVGNAIDALHAGGRLLIRSHSSTDWATGRKGLALTVADTGSGMSRETRAHIFEPFFTTKGTGGTGLGLWVSQEVAARHKGVLRVRSRDAAHGGGTVFRFFLPFEACRVSAG